MIRVKIGVMQSSLRFFISMGFPFVKAAIRISHFAALLAMTSEMKADLKIRTTVEPESFKKWNGREE